MSINQKTTRKTTQKNKFSLQKRFYRSLLPLILLFCFSLAITPVIAQNQINKPDNGQLIQQASQLYKAGKFSEAIPIWEQAIQSLPQDSLNQALVRSNLALTYQQEGKWELAKSEINQSLKILESAKITTEQQSILAQALDIQGQLQQKTGDSQAALNTWQQAAKLYPNSVNNQMGLINQINQAQAMQDLGLYPRACQTLLAVLGYTEKKCMISDLEINTIKDKISGSYQKTYQAKAFRSLGNVMRLTGNLAEAEKILQASLDIARKSGSREDQSKVLLNLGNTQRDLANRNIELNNDAGLQYQEQALEQYQKAASPSSSPIVQLQSQLSQLEILMEQGELFTKQGKNDIKQGNDEGQKNKEMGQKKWKEATDLKNKIKVPLTYLSPSRESIYAQIKYVKNSLCLEQQQPNCLKPTTLNLSSVKAESFQEAVKMLNQTDEVASQLEDKGTQSSIMGLLGQLAESRQDWNSANNYTQKALDYSRQAKAPELTYQWQWQEGRIFKAQGKNKEALNSYKTSLATLKSLRRDLVAVNRDSQFNFRENTEPVYLEYVSLLLQPQEVPPEDLKLARETIDSLKLAELENFLRSACDDNSSKPVSIDEVIDKQDPNAALIYPVLLEDRFEVIVKLPQRPLTRYTSKIEKNKQDFERDIADARTIITAESDGSDRELPVIAQTLYNLIIRPGEKDLQESEVKTLVFVLDSSLQNFPMSVLSKGKENGQRKYLIEQYNIALAPSLQLVDVQRFQKKNVPALIAGLSDSRTIEGREFGELKSVKDEINNIKSLLPNSTKLLNQEFTSNALTNRLNSSSFSIIHLATHGAFSSQPDQTFIVTSDKKLRVNELDNLLRSRDPVELLVLSACETLTGDKRASLGLAGVAIRGGTRSTLGTLWLVDDESTSMLMAKFYEAFKNQNISKADALRQAQLALLQSQDYKDPKYWAGYVLLGNWL
ncbi:MAG: CHAT domain-containing protein [Dolichospermum sp. DET50]|nr:CHAT domain-containing protein [Dolichospermum sp. DET66]MBS3031117.1 CHAT domain-containing protein [Dolichospermum sp. DET67]MBS3036327.1 CHAT domain-containing protein [Dolichospermum sp. DET50]QSX68388.1 MAG: CHAT domain-containing protein [Dolichospermum sp. DET69]